MTREHLDRSLIRDLEIFSAMPDEDLDAILGMATLRRLAKNEVVFEQGAEASRFFILLQGRLKVVQTTADGQQIVVRHVSPGEIYGIARAMRRTDYPATAVAVVEGLTLVWQARQWDAFIARSPALATNALQAVGQRLQDAHTRIRELSTEEVERRVAHALLRLARQAGTPADDGVLIDFPVSRQDIAEMTGSTLHTVSRVMSAWEGKGLVSSGRKRVVIREPDRLRALAERPRD